MKTFLYRRISVLQRFKDSAQIKYAIRCFRAVSSYGTEQGISFIKHKVELVRI